MDCGAEGNWSKCKFRRGVSPWSLDCPDPPPLQCGLGLRLDERRVVAASMNTHELPLARGQEDAAPGGVLDLCPPLLQCCRRGAWRACVRLAPVRGQVPRPPRPPAARPSCRPLSTTRPPPPVLGWPLLAHTPCPTAPFPWSQCPLGCQPLDAPFPFPGPPPPQRLTVNALVALQSPSLDPHSGHSKSPMRLRRVVMAIDRVVLGWGDRSGWTHQKR